jgi:hypothetical protein
MDSYFGATRAHYKSYTLRYRVRITIHHYRKYIRKYTRNLYLKILAENIILKVINMLKGIEYKM